MQFPSGLLCCALLFGFSLASESVSATVSNANSNGYGILAEVSALGLDLNVGPLPNGATGSAPPTYNVSSNAVNVNVASNIPEIVAGQIDAGAVNGSAMSNVLVAADVILGHSEVDVTAVPEPATAALLGLGLLPMTSIVRFAGKRHRELRTQPLNSKRLSL